MRKLIIGAILSVACACGIFVYTSWEQRRFADSLPKPPVVESIVDLHTHPHPHEQPHLHADSRTATDASAVETDSEPGAEKNTVSTSTEQTSEEDTRQVEAAKQFNDVEETSAVWHTDDEHEHEHPSRRSPFGKKLTHIEDMDPDELADMTLASLLRRFGDIPEVHTFVAIDRKRLKNQPLTLDEHIDFTRAQLHLFPDPRTKKTLELFLERRATEYPRSTKIVK